MADSPLNDPDFTPLTRTQILVAMGFTAIVLLLVSKVWLHFGAMLVLPVRWQGTDILLGIGIGIGITIASAIVYALWADYRRSADYYLEMVLKPLVLLDLVWLGLLPGLSEELLFRGVMLPAFGYDTIAIILSSLCFGALHLSSLQQWPYVVWATIVGSVLGTSAILTHNLLVPITAHVVTNLISGLLWKWDDYQKNRKRE